MKLYTFFIQKSTTITFKEESNSKDRQTPITATALPCAICGSCFPDAFILQKHWLSHVCDRPHICKLCDAGFTTVEALNAHTLTHQNVIFLFFYIFILLFFFLFFFVNCIFWGTFWLFE